MSTYASVSYNNSKPKRDDHAYRVWLLPSPKVASNRLTADGPAVNNVITYSGIFSTKRDAVAAIMDIVRAPCLLLQNKETGDVYLKRWGAKTSPETVMLATRSPTGMYVADAA